MTRSKSAPLLVALALTVVVVAIWGATGLFVDDDEAPVDAPAAIEEPAGGGKGEPPGALEPGEGPEGLPALAEPAMIEGEERTAAPTPLPEEETYWLEGRVVLPPGTPDSERVRVLALADRMTPRRIYDDRGPAAEAWKEEGSHLGPFAERALLGAALAAEDGSFRLPVPVDTKRAHLALAGRYSFSKATTPVSLPTSSVTLTCELGAWITGTLLAPPGAPDAAQAIEGLELELGPDLEGGFNTWDMMSTGANREAEADGAGRFEFRGVPTSGAHGVSVKPEGFAALVQSGLRPAAGEHLELELRLLSGATVSGRVVDEGGRPVADAEVAVRLTGLLGRILEDLREAQTDEEGRFTLANVTPGRLEVVSRHESFRDGALNLEAELQDGEERSGVELELARGESISGRVVFPAGDPAVEARIEVTPDIGTMGPMAMDMDRKRQTKTDATGGFEVAGLSERRFRVNVALAVESGERAGTWKARAKGVTPGEELLEIVLEAPVALRGRVVDLQGQPIADFRVAATLKGSGIVFGIGAERISESFEERAEGDFLLEGLREGSWGVEVTAEGYASSGAIEIELPTADGAPPVEFTLPPAGSVAGRVVDTVGRPVPGALVQLEFGLAERIVQVESGGVPSAVCDTEGRYLLDGLNPGAITLVASADGFASSEPGACDVIAGERAEGVNLALRRGGVLTGEVLDDEGRPDAGVMVIVQCVPTYTSQHMLKTDPDGRFRVEHLEPGPWQVVCTPALFGGESGSGGEGGEENALAELLGSLKMEMVEIEEGGETHVLLGAPPEDPVNVRGKVTHDGAGVTGVVVSFMPEDASSLGAMKMKISGDDGGFEVELDHPGSYLVTVQHTDAATQQRSVEFLRKIPSGVEQYDLELELPHGRISGRVVDSDGSPLVGCRITLHVDGGMDAGTFYGGNYTETVTDGNGRFDIEHLRPGSFVVAAGGVPLGGLLGGESQGGRVVRGGVRIAEGEWKENVDFELEDPAQITGTVLDVDGRAVSDATVFIRNEDGGLLERFSFVTTDAGGHFTYKGLAPGRYKVSARKGARASRDSEQVFVRAGDSQEVRVSLLEGTVLRISVEDAEGEVVRAKISVIDDAGHEYSGMASLSEIMEEFGRGFSIAEHRVGPLAPGRYRIEAVAPDGNEASKPVNLSGKPERKVRLRLR